MATVPPDDLNQLLAVHKVKVLVLGDGPRKAQIAQAAEVRAAAFPQIRLAIWIKNPTPMAGIPANADVAVLRPDNSVFETDVDGQPDDLANLIIMDSLYNSGAGV